MKKSLYNKLALSRIRRYKNLYIPYILNCISLMIITLVCMSFSNDSLLNDLQLIGSVKSLMKVATFVMIVFSTIIINSTYNYIYEKKLEESGTFLVLGMEKKHLSTITLWEIIYIAFFVIVVGFVGGIIIYKIALAIFFKILGEDINVFSNGIFETLKSNIMVVIIFSITFFILFIKNVFKIRKYSPIKILNESKSGHKEIKHKILISLVGALCLAIGYYISLTTINPFKALMNLWIAICLVIVGTFYALSIIVELVLNLLRKNKKYYYKKDNFSAISGLLYRVRNSSNTLSAITILSCGIMVLLTSSFALYFGISDVAQNNVPSDIFISQIAGLDFDENEKLFNQTNKHLEKIIKQEGIDKIKLTSYVEEDYLIKIDGENFKSLDSMTRNLNKLSTFNKNKYKNLMLIYINNRDDLFSESNLLELLEKKDDVKLKLKDPSIKQLYINKDKIGIKFTEKKIILDNKILITNDKAVFKKIRNIITNESGEINNPNNKYFIDSNLNKEDIKKLSEKFNKVIDGKKGILQVKNIYSELDEISKVFSSVFFVGILLGIEFLFSTALFIYYKQLNEGYEDIERFKIMRQVGMTDKEAKKLVSKQILLVFMLPVIFTIIHISFAIPLLYQFLLLPGLANKNILLLSALISFVIFILFYLLIYNYTKKIYLNLILEKNKI